MFHDEINLRNVNKKLSRFPRVPQPSITQNEVTVQVNVILKK